MLTVERDRDIMRSAGGGSGPAKKNRAGRWAFREGRIIDKVLEETSIGSSLPRRSNLLARSLRVAQPLLMNRRVRTIGIQARWTPPHRNPPRNAHTPLPPPSIVKEDDDPDLR